MKSESTEGPGGVLMDTLGQRVSRYLKGHTPAELGVVAEDCGCSIKSLAMVLLSVQFQN